MSTILKNPVTIIFLVLTIAYSIVKIVENKNLYIFINKELTDLNNNFKNSRIYINSKNTYNNYQAQNPYSDINMTSFIEELASDFKHKNKFIIEEIKNIKNSSSICILLGVLGTFVGLSMMLLSVDTNDIINSLPKTISSMQTAFTTSIFGIICSILINFIIKLNDCEHILIQLMLKLENILTCESTHIKSERLDLKIEEVKNTIKQISKSIEAIERFDKISKDLNDFNDEFINGIETLKGLLDGSRTSIKTFDQSVRKLDKQFSILNLKFNKMFDKYDNQDDINREILLEMKESSKNIYESSESQYKVKEYIRNLSSIFGLYERSVQDLLTKLIKHEDSILNTQKDVCTEQLSLDNSVKELSNIIDNTSNDIGEKLDMMFSYLDLYKEATNIKYSNSENYDNYIVPLIDEEIYEIEDESPKNQKSYAIIKNFGEDDLNDK
ncbi:MotA/TolQ/ExbB proton channel family protein [Romboutsia maritimum]|nr:MotA/TolQ/ExbB proton channel family protein [Romboutsia maritimum]